MFSARNAYRSFKEGYNMIRKGRDIDDVYSQAGSFQDPKYLVLGAAACLMMHGRTLTAVALVGDFGIEIYLRSYCFFRPCLSF